MVAKSSQHRGVRSSASILFGSEKRHHSWISFQGELLAVDRKLRTAKNTVPCIISSIGERYQSRLQRKVGRSKIRKTYSHHSDQIFSQYEISLRVLTVSGQELRARDSRFLFETKYAVVSCHRSRGSRIMGACARCTNQFSEPLRARTNADCLAHSRKSPCDLKTGRSYELAKIGGMQSQ
jgi:hypothetical protein